ncbi:MAG: MBOAT family O-acyltransferase [Bacteroidota bacterium]|nr:MBOAT family O-acyltransferase [Bacteroidota bacterium]MDP4216444.1 MBOAT family O-acyltransferase [Bacteroidota bacterium]MDP4246307.1 MBOAT family O-acyltransferase [Bacteroidota bacterium]MDP4252428.1 MBOAT family O-acyltransferase [Bacteroidota bacterium]MDP4258606.1 MBOAT family O-acyltransferase [Bacteroidota bacterium]
MLFNSFQFLLFFLIVTPCYYLTPQAWRWLLLLLASCWFYAAFIPAYLLVLFAIILIDYTAGRLMEFASGRRRKALLAMSIAGNLGILVIFKYYNFFVDNVDQLLAGMGLHTRAIPFWHIILPIGLSFHTFQAMSYTLEVYKGRWRPEKHPGIYALYVMFYPQLVAGPIERPARLIPQFYQRHPLDFDGLALGLKKMLWGLFLKVVVADRLAIYVNYIHFRPELHSRIALITAALFYSFQLYCDFAGYSLIAIGAARTMGFSLMENFRRPFFSASLREFWTRWHISLSSWFRDYLYFPLGGSRYGTGRTCLNISVVFLLSGLWHGANWTFVAWGLFHALILVVETLIRRLEGGNPARRRRRWRIPGILYTFSVWTFSLILFRASSVQKAGTFIERLFAPGTPWIIPGDFDVRTTLIYSVFGIVCVLAADIGKEFGKGSALFMYHRKATVRISAYVTLVVMILLLGVFDGGQFIYFQF